MAFKRATILLILFFGSVSHGSIFSLGFDFLNTSIDGRFTLEDWVYLGFKVDPGIHTDGGDFDLDLEGYGRFPLIKLAEGLSLGPEGGLLLIRNGNLDNPLLYGNFVVDMVFSLSDEVAIYGHAPLASLQIFMGGRGNQDDIAFLTMGYPMELGFLLNF